MTVLSTTTQFALEQQGVSHPATVPMMPFPWPPTGRETGSGVIKWRTEAFGEMFA